MGLQLPILTTRSKHKSNGQPQVYSIYNPRCGRRSFPLTAFVAYSTRPTTRNSTSIMLSTKSLLLGLWAAGVVKCQCPGVSSIIAHEGTPVGSEEVVDGGEKSKMLGKVNKTRILLMSFASSEYVHIETKQRQSELSCHSLRNRRVRNSARPE